MIKLRILGAILVSTVFITGILTAIFQWDIIYFKCSLLIAMVGIWISYYVEGFKEAYKIKGDK